MNHGGIATPRCGFQADEAGFGDGIGGWVVVIPLKTQYFFFPHVKICALSGLLFQIAGSKVSTFLGRDWTNAKEFTERTSSEFRAPSCFRFGGQSEGCSVRVVRE